MPYVKESGRLPVGSRRFEVTWNIIKPRVRNLKSDVKSELDPDVDIQWFVDYFDDHKRAMRRAQNILRTVRDDMYWQCVTITEQAVEWLDKSDNIGHWVAQKSEEVE